MLGQATPWLECKQQESERPPMNQSRLPMATRRRVGFGVQGAGEISKIEGNHRSGQPSARMRP